MNVPQLIPGCSTDPRRSDRMEGMSPPSVARAPATLAALLAFAAPPPISFGGEDASGRAAPIGVWRGTSTCTDRVAAPACRDEAVVYEFTAGAKPGAVHLRADKVVDGQRLPMGEMDLEYATGGACWRAEVTSPRLHSLWCFVVDGSHMTGTGTLLPGKQTIRKIDVRRD
jgi:hypothetical protein